jgi:hypothetical protein
MRKSATVQHVIFAAIAVAVTTLVVVVYYMNHPGAELLADTWSYLYVVDRIQTTGQIVNFWRLPCYPLLVTFVYALTGQGNVEAVSIAQGILFVCATLEIYALMALIFKRPWIALIVTLLVGCNLTLLSYVKPLMSEGMGLWLLTSLALSTVLFLKTLRRRFLWLVAFFMLLLFMTRPEWLYFPPLLFAYILLIAFWRKMFLHILPHAIVAVILLYIAAGLYVYVNATQNNFVGMTWVQNINEFGKIIQYNMQNLSSAPQDASIRTMVNSYKSHNNYDPYIMMGHNPQLFADNVKSIGGYSVSIILHHPVTYIRNTIPLLFSSLSVFAQESLVSPGGLLAGPLQHLQSAARVFHAGDVFAPLAAIFWLCALCIKSVKQQLRVQALGFFILVCTYGIIITAVGGYRDIDYMRVHILFEPLIISLLWGTVLLGIHFVFVQQIRNRKKSMSLGAVDEQDYLLPTVSK